MAPEWQLAVWFTEEAIAAWEAAPRTTPALTLCTVFHLALRQTKGLIVIEPGQTRAVVSSPPSAVSTNSVLSKLPRKSAWSSATWNTRPSPALAEGGH